MRDWWLQNRTVLRIVGLRHWLVITLRLDLVREWCARVIYCHHNARVLVETEWRLSQLLSHATGGDLIDQALGDEADAKAHELLADDEAVQRIIRSAVDARTAHVESLLASISYSNAQNSTDALAMRQIAMDYFIAKREYATKCRRRRVDGPTPCLCCPDECVG